MNSLILNILFGAIGLCSGELTKDQAMEFKIEGKKLSIPTTGPDAKVIKCDQDKTFKNLYVAEVFLGTAGTSRLTKRTDIVVMDLTKKDLRKVLQKTIHRSVEMTDEETGENALEEEKHTYVLNADKKGSPQLQWDNEKAISLKTK